MATKKTNEEAVFLRDLPKIDTGLVTFNIVGDSPLIVSKWTIKGRQQILDAQMKKAKNGKEAKNPVKEFVDRIYWLDAAGNAINTPEELDGADPDTPWEEVESCLKKGRFGFPTIAFKACALDAGYQQGVISKKTTSRGAFFILGEYAEIKGSLPNMREDMVQIGGMSKVADIRFRPEFKEWRTELVIQYNKQAITPAQIANLLNFGGFSNGVGEWRPSKDGSFGRFHVE